MSATAPALLRIGDVAKLVGTTPRTIRFYEEKGLLPPAEERAAGQHRVYGEADVERLREVLRLKEVLGLSLEDLKALVASEEERALLRSELHRSESRDERARILHRLRAVADQQLALVERRAAELDRLRGEIRERQARIDARLASLDGT
jgi:MerR family transcriptional regulator, repressor of the yfmOP operon